MRYMANYFFEINHWGVAKRPVSTRRRAEADKATGSGPVTGGSAPEARFALAKARRAHSPPARNHKNTMYSIYVIKSINYQNRYVGSTDNVEKRLEEHNSGKCRYTKGRSPWVLIYKEDFNSRSEAMKREKFLKSGQGRKLLDEKLKDIEEIKNKN